MNLKTKITKIHYDKNAKGFWVNVLDFASFFYGIGSGFKNFLYDKSIIKPHKVDAYVISVGNITTGGVGKTPVVAEIAKYFLEKGEKVAIISRGYGGRLSNKNINVISDGEKVYYDAKLAGDEPYWLAMNSGKLKVENGKLNNFQLSTFNFQPDKADSLLTVNSSLNSAVVITSKNRYKASQYAIEHFGVTKIILDDGFQHRKLHRDLDIVLMDSEKGFGREKLLPAGPMREGTEAFKRIDKLVIVDKNTDHTRAEKLVKIMSKKMNVPAFLCKTEPDIVYNIKTGEYLEIGATASAICAIGQPEQFYAFLKDYNIEKTKTFDDHHIYTEEEIPKGIIITTEKDAVKMKDFSRNDIYALKLKTVVDVESLLS